MEAIILAGGLGTRLRGVIGDAPKCMAPVAGKPFLHHIFRYLEVQGCTRVILSLGYKHEVITNWVTDIVQVPFEIDWVIEEKPLGTGGGIRLALFKAQEEAVFILNGDTFFDVDLHKMKAFHRASNPNAECTIALKKLQDFSRYGTVETNEAGQLIRFKEKAPTAEGRINGGIYLLNKASLEGRSWPEGAAWSFEKDYLERCSQGAGEDTGFTFYGYESEGYFIDIGVPEDYERAQHDFKTLSHNQA